MNDNNRFSIGEIANLTGITIRTLQYYDNIGLVPLDKKDTQGRRFYKESDISRLQQVMFYKAMGIKISSIKELVKNPINIDQFSEVLRDQRYMLIQKMNDLKSNMAILEASMASILEMKSIPWGNLIQIIISLNKETVFEYSDVSFDEDSQKVFFDHYKDLDSLLTDYWEWKKLVLEAVSHTLNQEDPKGERGIEFAKKWENMIQLLTNNDEKLLDAHKTSYENRQSWPEEDRRLMEFANDFIDESMENYKRNGERE